MVSFCKSKLFIQDGNHIQNILEIKNNKLHGQEPPLESLPQNYNMVSCSVHLVKRGETCTQFPLMENKELYEMMDKTEDLDTAASEEGRGSLYTHKTIGHDAVQSSQCLQVFVGEEKLDHSRVSEEGP